MPDWTIRILETPDEMLAVESLQAVIWPGSDLEIVPNHMLLAAAHNGGLVLGAYADPEFRPFAEDPEQENRPPTPQAPLIGFVFGFLGLAETAKGLRPKHCSHMLGVHPSYRSSGVGFALKRAQWQMVRRQGLDRITWTYDPLLSVNAYLNIARLGAVCNTYLREAYGEMRDGLNVGLASDRFQVDWWVNTSRVETRLSKKRRSELDLAHFLDADSRIINPSHPGRDGWPRPAEEPFELQLKDSPAEARKRPEALLLMEIPPDFQALRRATPQLARDWRQHTRQLFEMLFESGYLVTDFIYLPGEPARSFYVISHGMSTF